MPWRWGNQHHKDFQAFWNPTVFAHYHENKSSILSCGVSPHVAKTLQAQIKLESLEPPISFAERTVGPAGRYYSQLDIDRFAIVYAVGHFHQYISGRHVTVTDHQSLLGIFGAGKHVPQLLSPRRTRCDLGQVTYNHELVYRRGLTLMRRTQQSSVERRHR